MKLSVYEIGYRLTPIRARVVLYLVFGLLLGGISFLFWRSDYFAVLCFMFGVGAGPIVLYAMLRLLTQRQKEADPRLRPPHGTAGI